MLFTHMGIGKNLDEIARASDKSTALKQADSIELKQLSDWLEYWVLLVAREKERREKEC